MEAEAATHARLIGAILVENGLITRDQLARALEIQEETGVKLGEIVVAEFDVPRIELAGVLAEQWAAIDGTSSPRSAKPAAALRVVPAPLEDPAARRPIGEIFVELGFITPGQLDAALERQRLTGERIGEVLVELGSLTRLDLASALAEQWSSLEKLRPPAPVAASRSWQDGSPVVHAGGQEDAPISDNNPLLADLDERLRVIERAAATSLTQEDLSLAQLDLRAALGGLEERLDEVLESTVVDGITDSLGSLTARLDTLECEPVSPEVVALRREFEELRSSASAGDALAEVIAAVERLEARPEQSGEIASLAEEIAALTVKVDDLAGLAELRDRIDAVAGQARSAETGVEGLAGRIDALVALEARLDEVAARTPAEGALDELREELSALAPDRAEVATSGRDDDIAALTSRIDELAAERPAPSTANTDDVGARLESLEEWQREDDAALERLASELAELGARTYARLDGLDEHSAQPVDLDGMRRRLDEVALSLESTPDVTVVDELRTRMDELSAASQASVDPAALEDLRAQVSALVERHDSIGHLEGRLGELEARIVELPAAAQLRDEMRQIAESTAAEHATLGADAVIRSELDGELAEVRSRLDELAASPHEDAALRERVDEMVARFAGVEAAVEAFAGLESGVRAGIDRAVAKGTEPLVERLDSAESKLGSLTNLETRLSALAAELEVKPDGEAIVAELAEVRSRLDELAASPHEDAALRVRVDAIALRLDSFDSLESLESGILATREQIAAVESVRVADALANGARISEVEASAASYLDMLTELDGRLSGLAADLEVRLNDDALSGDVAELQARIEQLATQALAEELGRRVSELADRAEAIAGDAQSSLNRSADELNRRIDGLEQVLTGRIGELNERLGGLVARDELDAVAAKHVEWFQAELVVLRDAGAQRAASLEDRITSLDRAREADRDASATAVSESLDAVRSELHVRQAELAADLQAQLDEQRAELENARADHEVERAAAVRLESLLEHGLAALATRISEEVQGARDAAQQEAETLRSEATSLGARIDEILGMRRVDVQAGRLADERLAEQLEVVAELRENDADVARRDTAELAARLDGVALHTAESAREVERGLREELVALAARVEGHDAAEIEAREELRGQLERLASSMGWRLERIEESLSTDESAALRETVADIERRLEGQSALGEEQVRATERALRKGLASLGERLVESESAYAEAGNTLRRSIERLGAAVVEADARMADQIPVSPLEGCVAFAPTADGYRLVELPGERPEVGEIVEVGVCDEPLVVTRYGRSPLPFDGRPCAYLDRV